MKKLLPLLILFFLSTQIQGQKPHEIIAWINDFENNYAVERILDRTTIDKVVVRYEKFSGKDWLIVRSHVFSATSSPPIIDAYIDLSKVVRINAEPIIRGNNAYCDVKICTSEDGIFTKVKMPDSDKWVPFPGEKEWYLEQGYCNAEIRLALKDKAADAEKFLERITNALVALSKMYGSNPAIGPLF